VSLVRMAQDGTRLWMSQSAEYACYDVVGYM
jgi:hypothetical protein